MNTRNKDIQIYSNEDLLTVYVINKKEGAEICHKNFAKTDKVPTIDDLHYQLEISFSIASKIRKEFIAWAKDKK